jgi:AbrB family looped-hinge helix DNA binding protein
MPKSIVGSKGQITIPKAVRDVLHLATGDRVYFAVRDDGTALYPPTFLEVGPSGLSRHRSSASIARRRSGVPMS